MDLNNPIVEEDVTLIGEEVDTDCMVVELDPNRAFYESLPDPLMVNDQNNTGEIEAQHPLIDSADEDGHPPDNYPQDMEDQEDDVIIVEDVNPNQHEARLEQIRQVIDNHLDSRLGLDDDNEIDQRNDPDYTPGRGIQIPKKQLKASTFKAKNLKIQFEKLYKKYDD